jgi:RHS repeat-associated protein
MRTVRTISCLLIATLWLAPDARAYHKPGWDTGHQTMNSNPGVPQVDPGETRPNGCGSPVEVASGNFIHALPQLSLSGVGPDVDLTLIYNSHDLRRGAFGVGWTHAWEERLIVTTDGAQIFAICCQGRGKRDRMLRLADGRRYATATLHLTMVRNPNETHTLRDKHGNVKEFDTDGKMTRLVDRNGNAVALGYDGVGFLTTITDAAGRVTRFTKGTNGRVASVTDPANRVFQYAYDASGHLTKVTDPLGQAWTFDYDDKGLLSEIVDPRGNVQVGIAYDELRRVQTLTEREETWTYSYATRQTTKRDSYGDEWSYQYNEAGSITRATNPLGKSVAYTYDAALNTTSITDENGRLTRYTYDGSGNVVSMTDALGNVYSVGYDAALSLPVGLTDPLGNATQLQYDSRGNLTAVTDPGGAVSRFTYDAKGQMTQATDASGAVSKFVYDPRGYVVSFTAPGKTAATATYDVLGNLLTFTDARGMKSDFAYDANRRLLTSTNPAGAPTSRQYDPAGNLTTLTLPNGAQFRFEYDAYNRLLRLTNPVNETTIYNYDHRGNITWSRGGQGRTIVYQYDALDRLLTKSTPEDTARYTYDAAGNLLSINNGSSGLTYTYDALNRVLKAGSTPQNVTITYAYDAAGQLESLDDGESRSIRYSYNRRSLVASISDFDGFNATFSYDPNRRRIRMERTGGFATTYSYDGAGRLLSMKQTSPAGPLDFAYTYDQSDNRVSMTDASGKHLYGYNRRDQLISASHPTADNPPETYSYDPVGNRIASHLSATHAYDAANRQTADATFDYTYDADGNPTQRRNRANGNTREYTYDAENRLTTITFPDGTTATYSYDGLGRRYEKKVAGLITRYVYTGSTILREIDSTGKTVARYTPGLLWDEMLAVRRGGVTSVVETDALGSVIRTVAGSTPNATFRYDSFGRVVAQTGAPQSPFAFQGRELDVESQLYYYRARYYEPVMGRFLTEDPIMELSELNQYVFPRNNPITFIDPSGLAGCWGDEMYVQACAVGPWDAYRAKRLSEEATRKAQESGLDGEHNGRQDAFRHCYWSCRMAQEIGPDQATTVGDTHEICVPNPPAETAMDRHNNRVGVSRGQPGRDCNRECRDALPMSPKP